jgi:hypothetical protein
MIAVVMPAHSFVKLTRKFIDVLHLTLIFHKRLLKISLLGGTLLPKAA